jgi:diguanylate cyclase (GGDEF)-like protein/PAS domain S-box-containing protein
MAGFGAGERGFYHDVVERTAVALVAVEPSGLVRWHTATAARFLGGPLIGRPLQTVCDVDDADRMAVYLHGLSSLATSTTVFVQTRVVHPDGTVRHLEVAGANLLAEPDVGALVLQLADVSERVAVERELTRLAVEDPLTGLPNRRRFTERLSVELERHAAGGSGAIGLLFLDLDRFKRINDLFGHAAGDAILASVAGRILACIRPTDMAARLGGDEFAILVGGRDLDDITAVAERILAAFDAPMETSATLANITASVGVATTATALSLERLLQQADAAMYRAKADGGARIVVHDGEVATWVVREHHAAGAAERRARELEAEVRRLAEAVRTDPLTGLPNRVRQREDLALVEDDYRQRGVPFCVAFVDIDAFGQYNKRFGEAVGDQVLCRVADALRSACRDGDTVYRLGGEEFVVVFRNADPASAIAIAERMNRSVAVDAGVTVSIGVAAFDPVGHTGADGAVAAADEAMRGAKRAGGNQVLVATPG